MTRRRFLSRQNLMVRPVPGVDRRHNLELADQYSAAATRLEGGSLSDVLGFLRSVTGRRAAIGGEKGR